MLAPPHPPGEAPTHDAAPRRRLTAPRICKVDGCGRDVEDGKLFYRRGRCCEEHAMLLVVHIDGQPHRFCQKCCRFHSDLSSFEGTKRSCKRRLADHNARRQNVARIFGARRRAARNGSAGGAAPASPEATAAEVTPASWRPPLDAANGVNGGISHVNGNSGTRVEGNRITGGRVSMAGDSQPFDSQPYDRKLLDSAGPRTTLQGQSPTPAGWDNLHRAASQTAADALLAMAVKQLHDNNSSGGNEAGGGGGGGGGYGPRGRVQSGRSLGGAVAAAAALKLHSDVVPAPSDAPFLPRWGGSCSRSAPARSQIAPPRVPTDYAALYGALPAGASSAEAMRLLSASVFAPAAAALSADYETAPLPTIAAALAAAQSAAQHLKGGHPAKGSPPVSALGAAYQSTPMSQAAALSAASQPGPLAAAAALSGAYQPKPLPSLIARSATYQSAPFTSASALSGAFQSLPVGPAVLRPLEGPVLAPTLPVAVNGFPGAGAMSVPGREMRPHLHSAKGQSLLLQLPPELLGHIFSYLPVADKAQRVQTVCLAFRRALQNPVRGAWGRVTITIGDNTPVALPHVMALTHWLHSRSVGIDTIQLRASSGPTLGGAPSSGQCNAGVLAVLNVVAGAMPGTPLELFLAWVPDAAVDAGFLRDVPLHRLLEANLVHLSGRFSNLDLTRLGSLRALRRLHISAVDLLPGQQPRALEGELPSLEHLELFGIWLLPRLVAAVALPALQSLCIWSADAGSSLNCVSHLTTLRSLSVDICDVGDGCRLDLRPLRHLTRLDLSRSILPGRWDALHGARALRELCFDGDAHVVDEGLVAAVAALPTLRVVCASGRVASNQPLLLFGQLQSMLLARGGRLEL